jgi:hypothetical protein
MHCSEQFADEIEIALLMVGHSELVPHAGKPVSLKARRKRGDRLAREFDRPFSVRIHQRKQSLGEPGKIPLRNGRLIGVGVAPKFIDRAEGSRRIERIHEGAWSKIDGLSRKRRVVGVHHAMDETDMHPARDQRRLAFDDGLKKRKGRPLGISGIGEVAINDVIGKTFDGFQVAARCEILEGPDADVTGCDPGQHGSRQRPVAVDSFSRRDGGQGPCGRNSERMHRFAHEIFAQDRPQCRAAVSAPRERRSARALQLDIAPFAVVVQDLAEEDCAAIAKLRNEIAELMPGIGHRDRLGARRRNVAGKQRRQLVRF